MQEESEINENITLDTKRNYGLLTLAFTCLVTLVVTGCSYSFSDHMCN
jgi:hypothetical protein